MCGITGIIHCDASLNIDIQLNAISHRGPDDFGVFHTRNLSLGHRRLSIQDTTKNGHQPMFTNDDRYCIIFNGEIYNHWDIRKELLSKYTFKSNSDTETLLYGYVEFGIDILNKLNGIFAFAIFDNISREILIARDQFGVKPLYYYHDDNVFSFSSEIKSFNYLFSKNEKIDYKALVNYIHFLYSPGEQTPLTLVKKLLPGYYIKADIDNLSSISFHKYYDIPFNSNIDIKTEEAWIDELEDILTQAVQRQLLADVPVGFFLSGGLDSSSIVAIAKKIKGAERLKCYTIDTESAANDGFQNDLYYAKLVAKHLDVDLEIVSGSSDIVKDFDMMIYHLDEPQADPAPLHILNICRTARNQGYIVLLGGTAGDDLFSGYRRHQALNFEKYFNNIPAFARKMLSYSAKNLHWGEDIPTIRRIKKLCSGLDKNEVERMAGYYAWISLDANKKLFSSDLQSLIASYNPADILFDSLHNIPNEQSKLNQMLYWDMKFFLTDHNLNYTDKLSMAVGVEVRVPFLDLELVEFSTRLPVFLKMKGKTTKYLLKKLMERYLPHDVIYRPKTGFGAPVRQWITKDLSPMIAEQLSSKRIVEKGIFDPVEVQKLIDDNKSGKIDASYTIWTLLAIDSWITQFLPPQ